MTIFQTLNDAGKTIVLITHDQKVAACAKRKVSINDGVMREE